MEEVLARTEGLGVREPTQLVIGLRWRLYSHLWALLQTDRQTDTHVGSMSPFPFRGGEGATSEDGAISHGSRAGGLGYVSSHIQDAAR